MDSISIAVEDFDAYCVDTLNEGVSLMNNHDALSMESWSTTSMTSISTEGLIDWVKDKLKKIGHKFVVVVNKIVARFSKNREKLERNIEIYKKNPDAKVQLAVSPKTLAMICGTIAAISAAIVAVILCIPKKDGKQTMERVEQQVNKKVEETHKQVESDKKVIEEAAKDPAKAEKVQVSAKQAENDAKKMIETQAKSEAELKKITNKVTGLGPQGGDKNAITNLISNTTKGCSTAMHMAQKSTQLAAITTREPVINRDIRRKAAAQERRDQNRNENATRSDKSESMTEVRSSYRKSIQMAMEIRLGGLTDAGRARCERAIRAEAKKTKSLVLQCKSVDELRKVERAFHETMNYIIRGK